MQKEKECLNISYMEYIFLLLLGLFSVKVGHLSNNSAYDTQTFD